MGSVNGGVWRTTNGGQTWENLTDGKSDISSVGAITVAPSDANVIYVGTGESQLREDLTHALVHDMRGPLTGVIGALDVLGQDETGTLDSRQRQLLALGRSGAARLATLVDSLLEVSRLESGQVPVRAVPVTPDSLVRQSLERHADAATRRQLNLTCHVAAGSPPALADPDLVPRVLDNLIGNAVKFVPPGGTIEVSARRENGALLLEVRDDGPGLPTEMLEHAFEPFFTSESRGTGLGLYLARELCVANSATIRYETGEASARYRSAFVIEPKRD